MVNGQRNFNNVFNIKKACGVCDSGVRGVREGVGWGRGVSIT